MMIERISRLTGISRRREIDCTPHQLSNWEHGALVQDAFPHLSADDREFIISGITPEEFRAAFGTEDDPIDPTPDAMNALILTRVGGRRGAS